MTPEGEAYVRYIAFVRDAIIRELETVPEEALNWPLGVPETNTLYMSAFHASMSVRSWVLTWAGGEKIERDRDAEFKASGTLGQLRSHWDETVALSEKVVERLHDKDYASPRRMVFLSNGAEREGTARDCVLHAIEHANIHLGHIQVAKQLYETKHG